MNRTHYRISESKKQEDGDKRLCWWCEWVESKIIVDFSTVLYLWYKTGGTCTVAAGERGVPFVRCISYVVSLSTPGRIRSPWKKRRTKQNKKNEGNEMSFPPRLAPIRCVCVCPFRCGVSAAGDGRSRPVVHEGGRGQHPRRVFVGVCRRAQQPSGWFCLERLRLVAPRRPPPLLSFS